VSFQIDRAALATFVLHQASLVETSALPTEPDLLYDPEALTLDDVRAIWLGVGISTQIGRVLIDAPERFVCDRPVRGPRASAGMAAR
jgi:hypothetical protein